MQQKDLLIIALFSFITVFVWILSNVYHTVVTSQITPVQEELIIPLNPTFNDVTIDMIRDRKQ